MSVQQSSATVDLFVLTSRASAGELSLALIIDLLVIGATTGFAGALTFLSGASALVMVLCLAGGLTLAGYFLARWGRSLGCLVLGVRLVDSATASPASVHFLGAAIAGRLRAVSLRRGRDPITAALAPFAFPDQVINASRDRAQSVVNGNRPALVLLDSGQQLLLQGVLILGRGPFGTIASEVRTFEWADLSRTVSKTHLKLEWDGTSVWATDLGSTNGTALNLGGEYRRLRPGERVALPAAAQLAVGDRLLSVELPRG